MSWFQRHRIGVFVTGLLVFSLFLFLARMKSAREQNWLDRTLVWVTAPLQKAIVWVVDGVAHVWTDYVYLVGVEEQNEKLRKTVEELGRKTVRIAELESENERLQWLTKMRKKLEDTGVVGAKVIGVSTSPAARHIRIDVGKNDGVNVGAAVIGSTGLVGKVTGTTGGYSEVTLLVDGRSAVDVVVEGSRARGIVRGQGEDDVCKIDYLLRSADVSIGNRVVTSGIGGVFPAGLLVGEISFVTSPNVGVFREAELKPSVPFRQLEEVLVVVPAEEGEGKRGESP
jgi:rod shape-determining protein MreC